MFQLFVDLQFQTSSSPGMHATSLGRYLDVHPPTDPTHITLFAASTSCLTSTGPKLFRSLIREEFFALWLKTAAAKRTKSKARATQIDTQCFRSTTVLVKPFSLTLCQKPKHLMYVHPSPLAALFVDYYILYINHIKPNAI